jgi:hypothetical protein
MVTNRRFGWRSGSVNARDITLKGLMNLEGAESLANADTGAISPYKSVTLFNITGAGDIAFSLADGEEGQVRILKMTGKAAAGNAVLTPTSFHDGNTLTFDTANDNCILVFSKAKGWMVVANDGVTVA